MGGAAGTMGTLTLPFLAFVFALLLIGYSIWDLDQLSGPGASGHYSLAVARPAPSGAVLAGVAAMSGAGPGPAAVSVLASGQDVPAVATGRASDQPGPARWCLRPGRRHRPAHPRPVGSDQLPDRHGRHHGVHAADHDLTWRPWAPQPRTG